MEDLTLTEEEKEQLTEEEAEELEELKEKLQLYRLVVGQVWQDLRKVKSGLRQKMEEAREKNNWLNIGIEEDELTSFKKRLELARRQSSNEASKIRELKAQAQQRL